jgi:hypothetical protein
MLKSMQYPQCNSHVNIVSFFSFVKGFDFYTHLVYMLDQLVINYHLDVYNQRNMYLNFIFGGSVITLTYHWFCIQCKL